jgi:hypothetical protein
MGKIRLSIPEDLTLKLKTAFNLHTLIETGTYRKAGTAKWAAEHFGHIYTIEGHEPFYHEALGRLAGRDNVTALLGDSREILPRVLAEVDEPALIWLDAHWLGDSDISRGTTGECPLREELRAIVARGIQHFILIDDARYFTGDPGMRITPGAWPQVDEIKNILGALGDYYFVDDFEDVTIAVPARAKKVVETHMREPGVRVVVPTSNAYVHCLPAFSYLFNKYWSAKQHVMVMRYDVRPPKLPSNFYNIAIGNQADYTWSSGLQTYLQLHYHNELLILVLEDYYIDKPIDTARIAVLWALMLEDPNIAKIDLTDDRLKVPHFYHGDGLVRSADDAPFQTSLQAAIWRKDFLLRILDPKENPWQFEKIGTRRLIALREAGEFSGLILGCKQPPVNYINAIGGMGNAPNRYDDKKFPPALWQELKDKSLI